MSDIQILYLVETDIVVIRNVFGGVSFIFYDFQLFICWENLEQNVSRYIHDCIETTCVCLKRISPSLSLAGQIKDYNLRYGIILKIWKGYMKINQLVWL